MNTHKYSTPANPQAILYLINNSIDYVCREGKRTRLRRLFFIAEEVDANLMRNIGGWEVINQDNDNDFDGWEALQGNSASGLAIDKGTDRKMRMHLITALKGDVIKAEIALHFVYGNPEASEEYRSFLSWKQAEYEKYCQTRGIKLGPPAKVTTSPEEQSPLKSDGFPIDPRPYRSE